MFRFLENEYLLFILYFVKMRIGKWWIFHKKHFLNFGYEFHIYQKTWNENVVTFFQVRHSYWPSSKQVLRTWGWSKVAMKSLKFQAHLQTLQVMKIASRLIKNMKHQRWNQCNLNIYEKLFLQHVWYQIILVLQVPGVKTQTQNSSKDFGACCAQNIILTCLFECQSNLKQKCR